MTSTDKIRAALAELGVTDFDLVHQTTAAGKQHSFQVTAAGAKIQGSTTRAIIRALRRHAVTVASRSCHDASVTHTSTS